MQITIEQLAEKLNGSLWIKGDLKRIYLNDAGWNTKKMTTKTFIWQDEDGGFKVSCNVDCPNQPLQWCESQEDEVKERVYSKIEDVINEFNGFEEITKENIQSFVGNKIEWKAPAGKGNEPYTGIAIVKSITDNKIDAECLSGDNLNYAFWDFDNLVYSDDFRYITCKKI